MVIFGVAKSKFPVTHRAFVLNATELHRPAFLLLFVDVNCSLGAMYERK